VEGDLGPARFPAPIRGISSWYSTEHFRTTRRSSNAAATAWSDSFYPDFIDPYGNAGQCEWTDSTLNRVFIHELGHAIGFTHPGEGFQISGTVNCSGDSCSTVMATNPPLNADCTTNFSTLRSDDGDAVTTVY
jgi:hypothetical protein